MIKYLDLNETDIKLVQLNGVVFGKISRINGVVIFNSLNANNPYEFNSIRECKNYIKSLVDYHRDNVEIRVVGENNE